MTIALFLYLFPHSVSYGGADGSARWDRWQTASLLRSLQWRQPLWRKRQGGGDTPRQQSRQALATSPVLLLLFIMSRLYWLPQLRLLLHPKRPQSVHLRLFGSPPPLSICPTPQFHLHRLPSAAAARAEDPQTGKEEKHGCAQRRGTRGCCRGGFPQLVVVDGEPALTDSW